MHELNFYISMPLHAKMFTWSSDFSRNWYSWNLTKTSMVLADTFWESMRMQYEMSTLFIFFKQAKITAPCWPYEYTSVCLMHINWVFSFSKHWITVLQLQDYMYMSNCCTGMGIMGYTNFLSNSWTSIFQECQASRVNKYKERTLVHTLGNNCIISST